MPMLILGVTLEDVQKKREDMTRNFYEQHKDPASAQEIKQLFDDMRKEKCLMDAAGEMSDLAAAILSRGLTPAGQ